MNARSSSRNAGYSRNSCRAKAASPAAGCLLPVRRQAPQPYHLVVVGGGASGCELSLAIQKRFARHPGFRVTLLQGNDRLLPEL